MERSEDEDPSRITLMFKTTQGTWTGSFDKGISIKEVIESVVSYFQLVKDAAYLLQVKGSNEDHLKTDLPLAKCDLEEGDLLVLCDLGATV